MEHKEETGKKRTRLVSMLGLGNPKKGGVGYDEVVYSLEGKQAAKTSLVSHAIIELCGPVHAVVILGTREVREQRHETEAIREVLERDYHFIEVPRGQDDAERWQFFEKLRRTLDLEPIPEAGETSKPERILFDVTHGFRTQPLFAMAALAYMQSEWARRAEEAPELRVLYGAYDPQQGEAGPPAALWDLTQFLTVTRWNAALDAFQRFGRADDLEALMQAESKAQRVAARVEGKTGSQFKTTSVPKVFGQRAQEVADDLALARFQSLLVGKDNATKHQDKGSAARLLAFLQGDEAEDLTRKYPVLRDSIERLIAWLKPLQARQIESPEGVRALAAFASLSLQLQRYAEAAAAVREGLVSAHAIARGAAIQGSPGVPGYHASREEAERAIGRDNSNPYESLFRQITTPRNDLLHGGLNNQPLSARSLREQMVDLAEKFKELAERLGQ